MIYLDNNATTKIDPRVLGEMMPFLTEDYANPASRHTPGLLASNAVKEARQTIAKLIGCEVHELIFTSGATEAINIGLKGVLESSKEKGKHIITVTTEHPAVLDTCRYLESIGYEVTYLGVDKNGLLDLEDLKRSLRVDTIIVSVMFVNNETGVIQPIKEISEIVHANGSFLMTDATQAVGKLGIDVNALGIDMLAMSGHKIYGPKGIGALYFKNRRPNKVRFNALIHGGGQEKGLRSGTLNVPGIVGLGSAAHYAIIQMQADAERIGGLREVLERELQKIGNVSVNGDKVSRLYNVSSLCFHGADADAIMIGLKDIALSNGSACSSESVEPSHVLKAMGLSDEDAYSTVRFSLGRYNTDAEIKQVIEEVEKIVHDLRLIMTP